MLENFLLWPKSVDEVMSKATLIPKFPVVIEAYWDGDTTGWMIHLSAIVEEPSQQHPHYKEYGLATLRGAGGDFRLFINQVPPWTEVSQAIELGQTISKKFAIPFYFPCTEEPDDECARWWEQEEGKPCQNCGKLIVQKDSIPYRGVCYPCYLKEERKMRTNSS
jgi:hypothetical protein